MGFGCGHGFNENAGDKTKEIARDRTVLCNKERLLHVMWAITASLELCNVLERNWSNYETRINFAPSFFHIYTYIRCGKKKKSNI